MKPTTTFLQAVVTARLVLAFGSMLALTGPASAGSTMAAKDTERNDRAADLRAIYAIEDRAEASPSVRRPAASRSSPLAKRLPGGPPFARRSRERVLPG